MLALASQAVQRPAGAAPAAARSSASSAPRSSSATASSRRRSRCSAAVEGLEVAAPGAARLRRADHARRPDRAVHVPAPRHGAGRQAVRAGDGWSGSSSSPLLGVWHIGDNPAILRRSRRTTRSLFMVGHPGVAFIALGSVVLCVTGAEALYADMGHFGKRPIRARLVRHGHAGAAAQLLRPGRDAAGRSRTRSRNPFYEMAPTWALYPLIALATCATVIASQALITAAFSVTKQAIQLGYLPRLRIAAHLGARDRADLRALRQLEPVRRHRHRRRAASARAASWPPPTASR